MADPIAVLVMAYGGPDKLEDVEPYLLDVRGHRETPDHIVEEVESRYQQIGGRSPILERTQSQAQGLARHLQDHEGQFDTFVGMRHWHPFIGDVVDHIAAAGYQRLVGLVMAPHYSRMSVGAYFDKLEEALEQLEQPMSTTGIRSWNTDPGLLVTLEDRIASGLAGFPPGKQSAVQLVFTAHSLPERILEWDDPYPAELRATVEALQERFPNHSSHFAYQSAAMTGDPWLGPDAGEMMVDLIQQGRGKYFLVVPIGFVCEHVEILYDIDIEFQEMVSAAGGTLRRIEMPNDDPRMMASLAQRVVQTAEEAGWV